MSLRSSSLFGSLPDLQSALIYARIVGACAKRKSLEVARQWHTRFVTAGRKYEPIVQLRLFVTRAESTPTYCTYLRRVLLLL